MELEDAGTAAPLDLTATVVRALMLYALCEAQTGTATTIHVTADGERFSISDDGRGHSLDKVLEGTSYLRFVYTHFDYPFEAGRSAPVQLQGIGMSLVNALCSELTLTVRKPEELLQMTFREGRVHDSRRTPQPHPRTGNTVAGTLRPQLQRPGLDTAPLQAWLLGVLRACPTLTLHFNGRLLQLHATGGERHPP